MRKCAALLPVLLAVLLLLSGPALAAPAGTFSDISGSEYYAEAVHVLAEHKILTGYADGTFLPLQTVTRAEMAAVVCRVLNAEEAAEKAVGPTAFDDVDAIHWASGYINAASERGIISGDGDGSFRPEDRVTHEEAIKMVVCALGCGQDVTTDDPLDWSRGYLAVAREKGISDNLSGAKGYASIRGDVAMMVYNGMRVSGMLRTGGEQKPAALRGLISHSLDCGSYEVRSVGRYRNWAGVSTVSQFRDQEGHFCFAVTDGTTVRVYQTDRGQVTDSMELTLPRDSLLGTAVCDRDGNLYLVWGRENPTEAASVPTVFVYRYSPDGTLTGTAQSCGGEGMPGYCGEEYYTKLPFQCGNCDAAISGNLLAVNYAREMCSGHQSNGLLVLDINTMTARKGFYSYNSHSFDQRVTAYSRTGGFLLENQGDCFARGFITDVTSSSALVGEAFKSFDFWVEENACRDYDMYKLNRTYALLGNILETGRGAALVGASARSLSAAAMTEPYDVFVQVFDPTGSADKPGSYVTRGQRRGMAGNNGNTSVTNYGVRWLTDLSGTGKTVREVQAVTTDSDTIVVLYELYDDGGSYSETRYLHLDAGGSPIGEGSLGSVRLNPDEDPVYAGGAVQWLSNKAPCGDNTLVLHRFGIG